MVYTIFLNFKKNAVKCVFMCIGILATFTVVQLWYVEARKFDVTRFIGKDEKVRIPLTIKVDSTDGQQVVLGNSEYFHWQGELPEVSKLPEATIKQHVLINSYMSCGSRFTGQFFGHRNDSFYFYEPLWNFNMFAFYDAPDLECDIAGTNQMCRKITGTQLNTMPSSNPPSDAQVTMDDMFYQKDVSNSSAIDVLIDVLTDIYKCRFDRLLNVVVNKVHADKTFGGPSWTVYRECVKEKTNSKQECLKRLENVCNKADHVVTKVLRITTRSLETLMERVNNIKVLHLYRDPRAIINSRREWKGYPIMTGFNTAQKLCDKMMVDLVGGLQLMQTFPDRVKFVFYEDLTSDVEYKTRELYKFLGMDPTIVTFKNADTLKKIANEAPKDSEVAKLEELRKKNNAFWWRHNLPFNIYGITQDQCYKIAPIFNLTYYKNESTLRDMGIPSMTLPNLFVIL